MLPVAAQSDEDKEKAENAVHETSRKLLLAMLDKPDATQSEWARATGVGKTSVCNWLKKLKADKLVDGTLGWTVTSRGQKAVGWKPVKAFTQGEQTGPSFTLVHGAVNDERTLARQPNRLFDEVHARGVSDIPAGDGDWTAVPCSSSLSQPNYPPGQTVSH